jgi:hypothetical protein
LPTLLIATGAPVGLRQFEQVARSCCHHLDKKSEQPKSMEASAPFKVVGIALAIAAIGWLSFVDPIWDAYLEFAEGEWLSVGGIATSVSASLIGVACAVYTACK